MDADFSHNNSLHSSVLAGKKLTNLFYKKPHKKSYFLGCSGGGRQGIKASEMFPNDFDGILAGVPAFDFNNLMSWRANFFTLTGSVDSPDFIMPSTWTTLIHNEILKQCDGLDGVTDGIIEHPDLCDFHLEALACPIDTVTDCLTTAQVEIVRRIFSPLYGEDSKLIYPAMQPGSEVLAADELYVGEPFPYSEVTVILAFLLFWLFAKFKIIRTGLNMSSLMIQPGMHQLSLLQTLPWLRRSIQRTSRHGPTTSPHFAV